MKSERREKGIFKRQNGISVIRILQRRSSGRFLLGKVSEKILLKWCPEQAVRTGKDLDSGSDSVPQLLRILNAIQILIASVTKIGTPES